LPSDSMPDGAAPASKPRSSERDKLKPHPPWLFSRGWGFAILTGSTVP
jgi:hypothetical protein